MLVQDVARETAAKFGWGFLANDATCSLISQQHYPDGDSIRLVLEKVGETILRIHDGGATFAKFRKWGRLTGRGRLAAFTVYCQAVCNDAKGQLENEHIGKVVDDHAVAAGCVSVQAMIEQIVTFAHLS